MRKLQCHWSGYPSSAILSSFKLDYDYGIFCRICQKKVKQEPLEHMNEHVRLFFRLPRPAEFHKKVKITFQPMEGDPKINNPFLEILPLEMLKEILTYLNLNDLISMEIYLGKDKIQETGIKKYKVMMIDNKIKKLKNIVSEGYKSIERIPVFSRMDVLHSDNFDIMCPFETYQPSPILPPKDSTFPNQSFHDTKHELLLIANEIFELQVMRRRFNGRWIPSHFITIPRTHKDWRDREWMLTGPNPPPTYICSTSAL